MYKPRKKRSIEQDEFVDPRGLEDYEENSEAKPSEPDDANTEVEEYRGLLRRLQADFINYKRRVEQEREDERKSANRELIIKLLSTLDDFARALEAVPQETTGADWVEGIAIIERKLMATLEEEGLTRIDAEGEGFAP